MNDIASTPLVSGSDVWFMILKSMGMLCVVLGLLIGMLYLLRKLSLSRIGGRDKSMIRLLSSFHLTPKDQVVLLDVLGRKILIGVTAQSITRITEFSGDTIDIDEPSDSPSHEPVFKHLLSRISRDVRVSEDDAPALIQNVEA